MDTHRIETTATTYDIPEDQHYDVVVVGGGAAGLSAALTLTRARRRTLVVDAHAPRNATAGHMQAFLSRDGMPPLELLAKGRDEVLGYGGVVVSDFVERIEKRTGAGGDSETDPAPDGFVVVLASGCLATARHVLVTTGLTDELPEIAGVREQWGRDVQMCPFCHGWEVRDRPVAVLGTDPLAAHQALMLRNWTGALTFFAAGVPGGLTAEDREKLLARGVTIVEEPVARVAIDPDRDRVTGVELRDGTVVPVTAVFVQPRMVANDGLLRSLGCSTGENGWVTVDPLGQTTVPGVWAAGNVTEQRLQVLPAAAAGQNTAAMIVGTLIMAETAAAVAARARG